MANRPYCRVKRLPPELWAVAAADAIKLNPANARRPIPEGATTEFLVQNTAKLWPRNTKLAVGFLDDASDDLKAKILAHMNEWSKYAEISFVASRIEDAAVRISLNPEGGFWSLIGTDIRHAAPGEATMNLAMHEDDSDARFREYVRHEAGHAIGFEHEHSRRAIVERIVPEKAYAYFAKPPNNWSKQDTDENVLTMLDDSLTMNFPSAVQDVRSIMCYYLPAEIMSDGIEVPGGSDIDGFDALAAVLECGSQYTVQLEGELEDHSIIPQFADSVLRDDLAAQALLNFRVNRLPGDNAMDLQYRLGDDGPWVEIGQWTNANSLRASVAFQLSQHFSQTMKLNVAYAIGDWNGNVATGINGTLAQLPSDSRGILTLWMAIGKGSS